MLENVTYHTNTCCSAIGFTSVMCLLFFSFPAKCNVVRYIMWWTVVTGVSLNNYMTLSATRGSSVQTACYIATNLFYNFETNVVLFPNFIPI